MAKVNFKAFKSEAEVEQFLASRLVIGSASAEDVAAFLKSLDLTPSALDKNACLPGGVSPSNFDALMVCSAPASPTLLIRAHSWWMTFSSSRIASFASLCRSTTSRRSA